MFQRTIPSIPTRLLALPLVVAFAASGHGLIGQATAADPEPVGTNIARTMSLLASATPEHRTPVRILFYGQSIVRQDYVRKAVEAELRRRYPHADLTVENRAIGGYTAPVLRHTAHHDLYPFYPDLVVFHVYGGERGGEFEEIWRGIRERTTAEILTWTHHMSSYNEARDRRDEEASEHRRELAEKYNCEMVDVRDSWKKYLSENSLEAADLLGDNIHVNARGGELMGRLVVEALQEPAEVPDSWEPLVTHFDAVDAGTSDAPVTFSGEPWRSDGDALIGSSPDSALKLRFVGNRVDVTTHPVPGDLGTARILLDGKPVSAEPACYAATLPTRTPIDYRPGLKRVELGENVQAEDWTIEVPEVSDDGREFRFRLVGTKTGDDGEGSQAEPFVSDSGRIRIDPKLFSFAEAIRIRKRPLPTPFELTFKTYLMGVDTWEPQMPEQEGAVDRTTVAQGMANGPHELTIIPNGDGLVPIARLTVYRPPLGETR
jgi:hypothetical protein